VVIGNAEALAAFWSRQSAAPVAHDGSTGLACV
jgi:hypothetical protein